jgi:hypothetical protein
MKLSIAKIPLTSKGKTPMGRATGKTIKNILEQGFYCSIISKNGGNIKDE